jgi:hypothetical protein
MAINEEQKDMLNRMCPSASQAMLGDTVEEIETNVAANTAAIAEGGGGDPKEYDIYGDGSFGIHVINGGAINMNPATETARCSWADFGRSVYGGVQKEGRLYGISKDGILWVENADPEQAILEFGCGDVGTLQVFLRLIDGGAEPATTPTVQSYVILQDNTGLCP